MHSACTVRGCEQHWKNENLKPLMLQVALNEAAVAQKFTFHRERTVPWLFLHISVGHFGGTCLGGAPISMNRST